MDVPAAFLKEEPDKIPKGRVLTSYSHGPLEVFSRLQKYINMNTSF